MTTFVGDSPTPAALAGTVTLGLLDASRALYAPTVLPPGTTYTLDIEFGGSTLDALLVPIFVPGDPGFGLDSDFLGDTSQCTVAGGVLTITANKVSSTGSHDWASACIGTKGTFSQLYGNFEARIKYPNAKGVWPAFWLLEDGLNTSPPEIDILEAYPGDVGAIGGPNFMSTALHYGGAGPDYFIYNHGSDLTGAFHVYRMDWQPSGFTFYVDGAVSGTLPSTHDPGVPMYPILNLALGATGARASGATPSTLTMEVDYLRVW